MLSFEGGLDALEEQFVSFHRNEIQAFSQQAEAGDAETLYHLASLILQDCPSPRFWDEGLQLLEKASESGHSEAQAMLMDIKRQTEQDTTEIDDTSEPEEEPCDSEELSADIVKHIPDYAPKVMELHKGAQSKVLFGKILIDTRAKNMGFILLYLALSIAPAMIVYYLNMRWRFYTDGLNFSGLHFSWWRWAFSYLLAAVIICVPVLFSIRRQYRSIVVCEGILFLFTWDNGLRSCMLKPKDTSRIELSRSTIKIYTVNPVFENQLKALHAPISGKSKNELTQALLRAGFDQIRL